MSSRQSDFQFALAEARHEPALRRLLRECPMPGQISLSLQREPNYFDAAAIESREHHALVAMRGDQAVAMGSISVQKRFYNGQPMRMGYLGGLRLHPTCQGRFEILRLGYRLFRSLHDRLDVPFYLTSVAADNVGAIRFLERNLPGMPVYQHVGDLGTALIRSAKRKKPNTSLCDVRQGQPELRPAIVAHLCETMSHFQFAPVWTAAEMDRQIGKHGLRDCDFQLLLEQGRVQACGALWDQRAFKQVVVSRYSTSMKMLRHAYNGYARATGRVRLPRPNVTLSQGFVSHLSVPVDRFDLLQCMLDLLRSAAHRRNIESLAIALDARDPRLRWLGAELHARVYYTRLYVVHWPDAPGVFKLSDGRLMYPEVALL